MRHQISKKIQLAALAIVIGATGCKKPAEAPPAEAPPAEAVAAPEAATATAAAAPKAARTEFKALDPAEIAALKTKAAGWQQLLPTPGEVFDAMAAMNKEAGGTVQWAALVTDRTIAADADRAAVAVAVGRSIADFLVLVHAQQAERAAPLAEQLLAAADRLGVGEQAREKGAALVPALQKSDWASTGAAVASIFEAMRAELTGKRADEQTALLIAVGVWLEGIRVVATHLGTTPNEATSGLLHQGHLAQFFAARLEGLQGPLAASPAVASLKAPLVAIGKAMAGSHSDPLTAEAVASIGSAATEALAKL